MNESAHGRGFAAKSGTARPHPEGRRISGVLLLQQVALGALLVAARPRPSTSGEVVFWLTVYVVICTFLQIVSVRYWNRHPRRK